MAKKTSKKAPPKVSTEKETGKIDSVDKATSLIKNLYSHIDSVEFLVLPNGAVYYGENRDSGRAYAKRNDLEYFDVKL